MWLAIYPAGSNNNQPSFNGNWQPHASLLHGTINDDEQYRHDTKLQTTNIYYQEKQNYKYNAILIWITSDAGPL